MYHDVMDAFLRTGLLACLLPTSLHLITTVTHGIDVPAYGPHLTA
jgi:hypothetical protein